MTLDRRRRRASRKQELSLAKLASGRAQPGSGCVPGCKGDVRVVGKWRIEAKFTTKRKYSLRLDDLLKIESECSGLEKPVFVVEFKNANNLSQGFKFAVVPFTREKALCYTDRRSYILHLPELITALQEKEEGSPLLTLAFVTYGKSFAVFYLDHWEEMVRGDADQDK